jgi:Colicin V production protein
MLELLTIVLMLLLAALQTRAGLFAALVLFCNVIVAGVLAFNFWEPLARMLGQHSPRLDQYADALWLTALVALFLIMLRWLTSYLAPRRLTLPPRFDRLGGALVGCCTGYLFAGLVSCLLQTLPLPERFLGYDPQKGSALGAPERVWLSLVHRTSGVVCDQPDERWFDADGSFAARYARYRRIREGSTSPLVNQGEFPTVLGSRPPTEDSGP